MRLRKDCVVYDSVTLVQKSTHKKFVFKKTQIFFYGDFFILCHGGQGSLKKDIFKVSDIGEIYGTSDSLETFRL